MSRAIRHMLGASRDNARLSGTGRVRVEAVPMWAPHTGRQVDGSLPQQGRHALQHLQATHWQLMSVRLNGTTAVLQSMFS